MSTFFGDIMIAILMKCGDAKIGYWENCYKCLPPLPGEPERWVNIGADFVPKPVPV